MTNIARLFENLSAASPVTAGRAALFLFTHPLPPAIHTEAEKRLARKAQAKLDEAERSDLRVNGYRIASYRFRAATSNSRGTVLLVHGWTSNAAFMTAPVEELQQRGFDVVAFDMPAHGKSSGRRAELMDCVLAMIAVADRYGPIDQVIAHSFGGPVTTLAIASGLSRGLTDATQLLFIASPNRLADVTEQFSRWIGISRPAQRWFEDRLVEPFGVDLEAMDGNLLLADCPNRLTVLHSRDDREVGFDAAEKYANLGEKVTLRPLDGLGHRRILHAQPSLAAMFDAVSA
ncbi:alpha/beta hydrolase [Aurantiacibacter sp. MUD61]|uniref:alpha/beta hydrolase n=1 Tax=Aurantiacibacter sp. MUD61 TaxID=3009083 RepID=UPI0022F06BFB|nr:alpha/beta fold hydrolase [Aurantiacibacter sp. MUD61]